MITRIRTTVPTPMYIGSPPRCSDPRKVGRSRGAGRRPAGAAVVPRVGAPKHRLLRENPPVPAERDRFRALLEATMALSSELSLDALLQKLVETAAELTGARYAALGVIDSTGLQLERFL